MKIPNGIPPTNDGHTFRWAWPYLDREVLRGYAVRYEDKDGHKVVKPYHVNEDGKPIPGLGTIPWPLFGINTLTTPSQPVYIVEGEKCVAALHCLGLQAVTSQGGSGAASKADWSALEAYHAIIILPDADEPGEKYASDVVAALGALPRAREVKIARLLNLPPKGDVVDWLQYSYPEWNGLDPLPNESGDGITVELENAISRGAISALAVAAAPTVEPTAETELLGAAIRGDLDAIHAVNSLDPVTWSTTENGDVAAAIHSLTSQGKRVDRLSVSREIKRLGLVVGKLSEITKDSARDPNDETWLDRRVEAVKEDAERRVFAEKIRRAYLEAENLTPEDRRSFLVELAGECSTASALTASDILGAPAPPMPIFTGGPVPGVLAVVGGESGISKSYLADTWALSMALGRPILESFTPNIQGPVLYFSYEDNPSVVLFRLGAIARAHNIPWEEVEAVLRDGSLRFYCDLSGPLFETSNMTGTGPTPLYRELETAIADVLPVFVLIDPMSSAAQLKDENANSEVAVVAQCLSATAQKTNTPIILLHHANKQSVRDATGGQSALRGASALACRTRWIMTLTRAEAEGEVVAEVVKDSYHKPADPVRLVRGLGGALSEAPERDPGDIVKACWSWLAKNPESAVSVSALIQRKSTDAQSLHTAIVAVAPWADNKTIKTALDRAILDGSLQTENVLQKNGKPLAAMRCSE